MNEDFAEEHPDLAKKMIKAHTEAIEYIYENPVKAAKIFADNYGVEEEVALMTIYRKTVGEGRTLTWNIDKKNSQDEIDYCKEVGTMVDIDPNPDDFIKTDLLEECGADDFDTFIKDKVDPVFPLGMSYKDWKKKAEEQD